MFATSELDPNLNKQSKRFLFLNELWKLLAKHVALSPNDDLATLKASTYKVDISMLKK